jgi:hypothetical protein
MKARTASLALLFVAVSYVSIWLPSVAATTAGTWTQSSQADWQSDTLNNLEAASSPGHVKLATGGSFAEMGLSAVNRTYNRCCGGIDSWIDTIPGTGAPVSGLVTRFDVYAVTSSSSFQLKVFRDNSTHYIFVGQSPMETLSNGLNSFQLSQPIPVLRGDFLGWYGDGVISFSSGPIGDSKFVGNTNVMTTLSYSGWSSWFDDFSVQAEIVPTTTGSLVSLVRDTGGTSSWGTLSWNGTVSENTWMSFYTRTSNDSYTWTSWSANYTTNKAQITSPQARFIQYQATLTSENITATPALSGITITYNTTLPAAPASPSFLSTYGPWLILAAVIIGFAVAIFITKPKTPKTG